MGGQADAAGGREELELLQMRAMYGAVSRRDFIYAAMAASGVGASVAGGLYEKAFAIGANQAALQGSLRERYDFIVCGAGSSGSVVARRLAENRDVSVLLLEAGGSDHIPNVVNANSYPLARFTSLFWQFETQPDAAQNNRRLRQLMGRVLGGGSSVNTMVWARGHESDYDAWAEEVGDPAWDYAHALQVFRKIEDWQGAPDPQRRGRGGPVWVQTAQDPCPLGPAMVRAAASVGIPAFEDHNGAMMEGPGGAALANLIVREGQRRNMPTCYLYPIMDQPNLTVLTDAVVSRVALSGKTAAGVEFTWAHKSHIIGANHEIVLSMGAFNTPRTLMLSGVGDAGELRRLGVPLVQHLPGVGANFQDHSLVASCLWESPEPIQPRNNKAEATFFWKSRSDLRSPDIQPFLIELPHLSDVHARTVVTNGWSLSPAIIRPRSRGRLRLRSTDPQDPVDLFWNPVGEPEEMRILKEATALCREIGHSAEMRPFVKSEILPAAVYGDRVEEFIRNGVTSYGHATCTAKMGRDSMAVVDHNLKVYGIERLRIADGSIMPNITSGNTMAPCVLIGERMGEILKKSHG